MDFSHFTFAFDITVEELESLVQRKLFIIRSEFADVFSIVLKNPDPNKPKVKRTKLSKSKNKEKIELDAKLNKQKGTSILYVGNIDVLMLQMMQCPMEVSLCSLNDPEERVGSTLIPWHPALIEYLMNLYHEPSPTPPTVTVIHNVFDEVKSKRMAVLRLSIKLHLVDDVDWAQYRILSRKYPNTFILTDEFIYPEHMDRSTTTIVTGRSPGIIRTIYSGGKKKKKIGNKGSSKRNANVTQLVQEKHETSPERQSRQSVIRLNRTTLPFTHSDTDVTNTSKVLVHMLHSKSCTAIKRIRPFDYIFGDQNGPFGNKVYTVGYFTVDDPKSTTPSPRSSSPQERSSPQTPSTPQAQLSPLAHSSPDKLSVKASPDKQKLISLNSDLTVTVKCEDFNCEYKKERPLLEAPDDRILLDITNLKETCCVTETVRRKMELIAAVPQDESDCFCACQCTYGFEKKTTYCEICKGYEKLAGDLDGTPRYLMPDPCPVYHKIKCKTGSTSGSESKKETKKRVKSPEPEKKERNDDRFKFNYGYKAPQIGHANCTMPCTGTMSNVPKHMGWLWTADNVPGLMFRPAWKPGAINKVVARMLKMARHPGQVISRRRKLAVVKKRPLKRPLLVVHKQDGEYTVTMETMKTYARPRTFNQVPYEDKPVLTYTIGRTEEENRHRRLKKERAARRLEREQRDFIQSAFTDVCQDICMKTYQQALGILPDAEDPECTCFPALPGPGDINVDRSCSCSEIEDSLQSDTDSDEWIMEFTPPNAYYDPKFTDLKVKTGDKETQYTYLDYRVKLVDRFGNPVPRFFKGPDGKEQCSDLGGFWSPDHKWLEINVDGYIGPDGRWAPLSFIGPNGDQVDTDTGKFQGANGEWFVVGVDGYVDSNNKWKFYKNKAKAGQTSASKQKQRKTKARSPVKPAAKKAVAKKVESEPTFSCFGDASPVELTKMGIVGHGSDKKLLRKVVKDLLAKGVKVKLPGSSIPKSRNRRGRRRKRSPVAPDAERFKCHHHSSTSRGVVSIDKDGTHYYRTKKYVSRSSIIRMHDLEKQGRSLSAFHEPCFHDMGYKKRPRRRRVQIVKLTEAGTGDMAGPRRGSPVAAPRDLMAP